MEVKCTSCGAPQSLNENSACTYCGSLIEVESAADFYKSSLSGEIGNLMAMAETATEAGSWEEAIMYFNRVLEKDLTNSDAWLGKGIGMVNTSTIGNFKIKEAIAYWKNAIKHAPNPQFMSKRVAKEINDSVVAFYPVMENHFIKFITVDNAYMDFLTKFILLESALSYALELNPDSLIIAENGWELCKRVDPKALAKKKPLGANEKEKIKFSALSSMPKMDSLIKMESKYLNKRKEIDPEKVELEEKLKKEKEEKAWQDAKKGLIGGVVGVIIGVIGLIVVADPSKLDFAGLFWIVVLSFIGGFFITASIMGAKNESQNKN